MSTELKEILGSYNGILFKEEALSPVFCKPKLIPLKSVTMNKLEEIQRESLIKMKEAIENASCDNETKEANILESNGQQSANQQIKADIWCAKSDKDEC
ncbi:unnamed protein product [Dracunculus medinensis]|uniref:BBSome-interacting protein 1 n=1 Tax=Dracunculus medinensis TaxID=318479 RepID=A0A0N4U619_DRAME|nr:unnamed protein product [Dracunculus medinensis]